jgi:hypothetical protein
MMGVTPPRCFIFRDGNPVGDKGWVREVNKMRARHPNWKGLGCMIRDGMRAVDVLRVCPEVDSNKIGTIGHSLGGKQALFVMAFDHRLKVGVSSDGGIGLTFSNWHRCWYLDEEIRSASFPLENNQVLAMIAPRPFLLVGGKFDNDRAWPFIAGAIPLWKSFRRAQNIGWYRHNKGHRWPRQAHDVAYQFLDRYLKEAIE